MMMLTDDEDVTMLFSASSLTGSSVISSTGKTGVAGDELAGDMGSGSCLTGAALVGDSAAGGSWVCSSLTAGTAGAVAQCFFGVGRSRLRGGVGSA